MSGAVRTQTATRLADETPAAPRAHLRCLNFRRLGLLVALALAFLATDANPFGLAHASAQSPGTVEPSGADKAHYNRLIDRALSAYQKRDFRVARQLFAEAHLMWPNARTLRGLGMADFELGEYVTAKQHLQESLQNPVKPLTNRLRKKTNDLLRRAEDSIGTLVLKTEPLELKLTVGSTPFDYVSGMPIELTAGSHALHLSAPGYRERHTDVDIQGGLTTELKFYLAELPKTERANLTVPQNNDVGVPVGTLAPEPPAVTGYEGEYDDDGSVLESPWLWITVGVLVVGTTVGVIALSASGDDGSDLPILPGL